MNKKSIIPEDEKLPAKSVKVIIAKNTTPILKNDKQRFTNLLFIRAQLEDPIYQPNIAPKNQTLIS